ncbi:LuxR C-terminal-related transcriptional regulator [Microbacterium sp. G2-8]|uniref:LuxR C-terminal-related transcriptional regulator n=1 Tax=Microbacterium sp. G2-8 TaxID=2842454 RepID=UPI0027E36D3B|nr:LuxR C-terminal-related transcriptional regulator [Microbacterium sp. G2-8]
MNTIDAAAHTRNTTSWIARARRVFLSPETVRTSASRILTKLGARDRTELAAIAHRSGLYTDELGAE